MPRGLVDHKAATAIWRFKYDYTFIRGRHMLKKNQLEELTDILEVIESLTFVETSCSTSSRVDKPFL